MGEEKRVWVNGKAMAFDTSFVHETSNDSDRDRAVLLIRYWHPELSAAERAALQMVFDISDSDGTAAAVEAAQRAAEKRLKALRGFGKK